MRAHVPAQVAAVLEHLAADAALVHPPVVPQLPELPPDAVAAREHQAPLEGEAAALMMGEPARLDKQSGEPGETGHRGSPRLPPRKNLPNRSGAVGEGQPSGTWPRGRPVGRAPGTSNGTGGFPSALTLGARGPQPGLRLGQKTTCARPSQALWPLLRFILPLNRLFFLIIFFCFLRLQHLVSHPSNKSIDIMCPLI